MSNKLDLKDIVRAVCNNESIRVKIEVGNKIVDDVIKMKEMFERGKGLHGITEKFSNDYSATDVVIIYSELEKYCKKVELKHPTLPSRFDLVSTYIKAKLNYYEVYINESKKRPERYAHDSLIKNMIDEINNSGFIRSLLNSNGNRITTEEKMVKEILEGVHLQEITIKYREYIDSPSIKVMYEAYSPNVDKHTRMYDKLNHSFMSYNMEGK